MRLRRSSGTVAMSTEPSANAPLFRRDALLHAGLPEQGVVLLAQPVPSWVLAALLVAAAVTGTGLLALLAAP